MDPAVHTYSISAVWKGHRDLILEGEGLPAVESAPPPAFQGREGAWTPEHLFVASASACYAITFLAIAETAHLAVTSFSCEARGVMSKVEGGFEISEIFLHPRLVIASETDRFKAERLLEKAEKYCLIARSMKTRVTLTPSIFVGVQKL